MKWILFTALVLVVALAARIRRRLPLLLQYAALLRFPLLAALALVALPILGTWGAAGMLGNLMVLGPWGTFGITVLALLATSLLMVMTFLIWESAPDRVGLEPLPVPRWLDRHRVLCFACLALPLLVKLWWKCTAGRLVGILAIAAGAGAALLILWILTVLRQAVVPPNVTSRFLLPTHMVPSSVQAADPMARLRAAASPYLRALPKSLGKGYVDYDTGELRPGHAFGFLALLVLLAAYLAGYVLGYVALRTGHPLLGLHLPPLGYVLMLLMLLTSILASVSLFLDRFRVPVLLAVGAWSALWYLAINLDHVFVVSPAPATAPGPGPPAAPSLLVSLPDAIEPWLADQRRRAAGRKPVLVVVCASGGGIEAAAWTARVLTGLQQELGERFTRSIRLISSVSGGSVGTLYFVEAHGPAAGPPPPDRLQDIFQAAATSSLEASAWGLVFPDLLRIFLPAVVFDRRLDRGWAIEQAWSRALPPASGAPPRPITTRLSDWRPGVRQGWRPGTVFNATIVETGARLLLSTVEIPNTQQTILFGQDEDYAAADLSVITAARLSATFPYVSPIARAEVEPSHRGQLRAKGWHVADGGYYDNFGVMTAIEWLQAVIPRYRAHLERIVIVQVRAFPPQDPKPDETAGWLYETIGPLKAILAVRTATQIARNDLEIALLQAQHAGLIETVVFTPQGEAPLSWHLTREEIEDLEEDWQYEVACNPGMPLLRRLFGRPEGSSAGCPSS